MAIDTGWQVAESFEKALENVGVNIDDIDPVTVAWMEFMFAVSQVLVRNIDDVMYVRATNGGPVGSFFIRCPRVAKHRLRVLDSGDESYYVYSCRNCGLSFAIGKIFVRMALTTNAPQWGRVLKQFWGMLPMDCDRTTPQKMYLL